MPYMTPKISKTNTHSNDGQRWAALRMHRHVRKNALALIGQGHSCLLDALDSVVLSRNCGDGTFAALFPFQNQSFRTRPPKDVGRFLLPTPHTANEGALVRRGGIFDELARTRQEPSSSSTSSTSPPAPTSAPLE
eukprot:scaffold396_cov252-Pinguiococcus_pyrenoidosus.AAC.5